MNTGHGRCRRDDHNRRCHPLNIPRLDRPQRERGVKLPDFENNVIACRVIHRITRATKRPFIKRSLTETRLRSLEFLASESLCRIYFMILNSFGRYDSSVFFSFYYLSAPASHTSAYHKYLLCRKVRPFVARECSGSEKRRDEEDLGLNNKVR